MENYRLSHLKKLETESIYILREVAAQFDRVALLYSVGKDSSVLLHLARKAFYPAKIPFSLLHVDTGFKFDEMYKFRDDFTSSIKAEVIVHRNEKAIAEKVNPYDLGTQKCCGLLKTEGLLSALRKFKIQAAIGGARRDEEKSRAKERIFSFRDQHGQWDPKNQRPELWNKLNGIINEGESIRAFPISNWTELDVWHYIHAEKIPIIPLYFAKLRPMIVKNQQLIPISISSLDSDKAKSEMVMSRFRTLGCFPCTGAIRSTASSIPEIIEEMLLTTQSERATRIIDHDSEGSMEMKKQEGYF